MAITKIKLVWVLDKKVSWAWMHTYKAIECQLSPDKYTQDVVTADNLFKDPAVIEQIRAADIVYTFCPALAMYLINCFVIDPRKIVVRLSGMRTM